MSTSTKVCLLCDDTGWRTVGEGKEQRVVRCDCKLRVRAERLLANARIPARYEHCDLSTYEPRNASQEVALLAAEKFLENYPMEKKGLLFVGAIGVGKSHLAVSIIKRLIGEKGVPCLFYEYRELLREIQNSYNPSSETTEMELLRPVMDVEVLLLDELGAVKPTNWVWDTVGLILNTRYNQSRTTILTSNYPDLRAEEGVRPSGAKYEDTLGDRITDRMLSRLHEMCRTIEVNGKDYRSISARWSVR